MVRYTRRDLPRAGGAVSEATDTCAVCGGDLEGEHRASCAACGRPFHQAWDAGAAVPQCGQVVAHQEALALVFLCRHCYTTLQQRQGGPS